MSNRTGRKMHDYPLTVAYLLLCTWVTFLVLILGVK